MSKLLEAYYNEHIAHKEVDPDANHSSDGCAGRITPMDKAILQAYYLQMAPFEEMTLVCGIQDKAKTPEGRILQVTEFVHAALRRHKLESRAKIDKHAMKRAQGRRPESGAKSSRIFVPG